jgi:hypothetical protein
MLKWSAIGVLLGLIYTVSPLTFLFGLLLPLLFWWAARGLEAWDRRWAVGLLAAATLLRVGAIAVLLLTTTQAQHFNTYFPDAHFAIARSWWVRNTWLDVPIGPQYRLALYDPYGATSYSYVLAFIQFVIGPSPYGLNFVSLSAFLAGAIALYRIARESFGRSPALIAFAVLLFWPTMFAWSVSMLKESMQFGLTALLIAFALWSVRSRTWRMRVLGALLAIVAGYAIATLRSAALGIAVSGVALGVTAWALTRVRWVAIAALVALVGGGAIAATRPAVQSEVLKLARVAADRQVGYWASMGYGYKTLDQRFYSYGARATRNLEPDEAVRFIVRSVIAFFTVPLPWQLNSSASLTYLPQQFAWYALALLAIPGLVAGFKRDALVSWILLAYLLAGVAVIAPISGNIGTLVRFRDMVVPPVALLGAAGFTSTLGALINIGRRPGGYRAVPV